MKKLLSLLLFSSLLLSQSKLEKITLQLQWLEQFQFAGYYVAKEKGFYKNAGLDVQIVPYHKIAPVNTVCSKESHYGIGRSSLLIDISEGKKIVLLKAIYQVTPLILMAIKGREIKTLADIRHKRVMSVPDISNSVAFQSMLSINHIDMTHDITSLEHTYNVKDLIENKTDLMAAYSANEPFILKQFGYEPLIFSPSDFGFEFYDDILFTTQEELKKHPQRVKKFIEATLKGWEWAFTHIDETAEMLFEKYNAQHKSLEALRYEGHTLKKFAYVHDTPLGDINQEKLARIYDIYKSMGLVNKKLDFNKVIYTNPSFSKQVTQFFKAHSENGNIVKILIILLLIILAILYWNRLLNKRVEQEIEKRLDKERLLFRENRLIAMGEMMSNIAHQWRQPINNINLLAMNIHNAHKQGELTDQYLDRRIASIEETVEYMSQTIEDFSAYLSPNKEKQTFSINESINIAIKLLGSTLKKNNIRVIFKSKMRYNYVGYKNEFVQILTIVLNNAKDALIQSNNEHKAIFISLLHEEDQTRIIIRDNAGGIETENLDKIFDPYFTTNHKSKGKGLGLYIAKMIVEESFNGSISAHNHHGACFSIVLG